MAEAVGEVVAQVVAPVVAQVVAEPMLALPSGEEPEVPGLAVQGALAFGAAVLVAFGALFGAWLSLRSGTRTWPPPGVKVQNYFGTTLSFTMLMVMLSAEWTVYSVRRSERGQAIFGYALTLVLDLAFINLLAYVVRGLHFGPATHPYGGVYYAFVIATTAAVAASFAFSAVAFARYLGGQLTAGRPELARAAACFAYAAGLGWFVMYTAVYVVG